MIALATGFFLVGYLLGPGAIFRLAFSIYLPDKRIQRNRTEEVVFSAIITILPLVVAWLLLLHTPIGRYPAVVSHLDKNDAYRTVLSSLLGDSTIRTPLLLSAYVRAFCEQLRFILLLWLLCGFEGWLGGMLVSRYGDHPVNSWRRKACDKFLLKYVSEWQVLFTTLSLGSDDPRTIVEVDVLSSGTLYHGKLVNWFTEPDGKLAGIFLKDATRYQREKLLKDRADGKEGASAKYWKAIPGRNLYLPAASIGNYNISYVAPTETDIIAEELGMNVVLTSPENSA